MVRSTRALAAVLLALVIVAAGSTAAHAGDTYPYVPGSGGPWIAEVNKWRAAWNVAPITEDASVSYNTQLHAQYMATNNYLSHSEDPSRPGYTPAGNAAGLLSDILYWIPAPGQAFAVDWWAFAPFHAFQLLDGRTTAMGFGAAKSANGTGYLALNYGSDKAGNDPTGGWPRTFPTGSVSVTTFSGGEFPDPTVACPYSNQYGTPILVDFGPNATITSASAALSGSTGSVGVCVAKGSDYSDSGARYILGSRRLIILPLRPLAQGDYYTGTVTTNAGTAAISFSTGGSAPTAPAPVTSNPPTVTQQQLVSPDNGAIAARYQQFGGSASVLGTATSGVECWVTASTGTQGCYQNYSGGAILWSAKTGAWVSYGNIRNRYSQLGFERSPLGFPTGPTTCGITSSLGTYGCFQDYEGGAFLWSQATGAWESYGYIRGRYAADGYEHSAQGLPVGPEVCGVASSAGDLGCYQNYESGAYVTSQSGTFPSNGPTRARWGQLGWERGALGFPASDVVCGLTSSTGVAGCYQNYEGGAIITSALGTWESEGATRQVWNWNGWERGWLGLPTGPLACTAAATCSQTYEGGIIRQTPSGTTAATS